VLFFVSHSPAANLIIHLDISTALLYSWHLTDINKKGLHLMTMQPSSSEMATANTWTAAHLEKATSTPPFSFVYDGKPAAEFLPTWKSSYSTKQLDDQRLERTLTYTDPKTGLEVRCVAVEFPNSAAVEWILYFKNTGKQDTPILSDIFTLDATFTRPLKGEFTLHHNTGDPNDSTWTFEPLETRLQPNTNLQLAPVAGFSCQGCLPYFNIDAGGQGFMLAIGWPGQWSAQFSRNAGQDLRITAGQQFARFKLHPGEEVRTPRIVLLHWEGDAVRGNNLWRRWMIAHNVPRPGGKFPHPWIGYGNSGLFDFCGMTEENQIEYIDRIVEEKIPVDLWWIDAGWYPIPEGAPWWNYGTWEYDRTRFPNGLKPVFDYARTKGLGALLWFCPEPVRPGTDLRLQHPEWLLGPEEFALLNLGNPEAWHWLVEHNDAFINELDLDVYRNDNDYGGLDVWRANDEPDRLGITEIGHVIGLLNFYDELLRRHPNLLIDNCCAGGRRNDIEMLRRSVPLWRSDIWGTPLYAQTQTYGMASWYPIFGHASSSPDLYMRYSSLFYISIADTDMRNQRDYTWLREWVPLAKQLAPNLLGDFYPLTPFSREDNVWMAWQFNRPEVGEGLVQAFRRPENNEETACLKLHDLVAEAQYEVTDIDENVPQKMSGQELMEKGLTVKITAKPGAAIITYKKA
jgi:alpha-galactosidase